MPISEFRKICGKIEPLLKNIFKERLAKCYNVTSKSDNCKGQYWSISCAGFFDEQYGNNESRKLERKLFYLETEESRSRPKESISDFFEDNKELLDELIIASEASIFNEIADILKGSSFHVSIDAKYMTNDSFYSRLLNENICLIEPWEEGAIVSCMMSERWMISVKSDPGIINHIIPCDKFIQFPNAKRVQSHPLFGEFDDNTSLTNENYIFMIMSFSSDPMLEDTYSAIGRAVRKVDPSIVIERVDQIEDDFKITEKILECINKSKVIISDLTDERPNVYFELGYARGIKKKVIQIAKEGTKLHFDIKDINTIFYRNATDLELKITRRLEKMFPKNQ